MTPLNQARFVMDIIASFQELASQALAANYGASDVFDQNPQLRLATVVMNRSTEFADDMEKWGHKYVDNKSRQANKAVREESGIRKTRKVADLPQLEETVPEALDVALPVPLDMDAWLTQLHINSRGFETGCISPSALATSMKEYSSKWPAWSLGYIADIITIVHGFIVQALASICNDRHVEGALLSLIMDDLLEAYQRAVNQVKLLLHVERNGTPLTLNNHYFNDILERSRQARSKIMLAEKTLTDSQHGAVVKIADVNLQRHMSNEAKIGEEIHHILFTYYRAARKRFVDNILLQATMYHLIDGKKSPLKLLSPGLVLSLSPGQPPQMEALAAIGLVGNILQFVDFSSKLVKDSRQLYQSQDGYLVEYADIEKVTADLKVLNAKVQDQNKPGGATGDDGLRDICRSCDQIADELLSSLNKIKVKDKRNKWQSIQVALRACLSKNEIKTLEDRLARFKQELNLRISVGLSEQLSATQLEQSDRLNIMEKNILRAILTEERPSQPPNPPNAQWSVPFMRNPQFVGRTAQLHDLEDKLFVDEYFQKAAIAGLGGLGKTQLALELAYQTRTQRPGCSVFWVVATSAETAFQSVRQIALQLAIPGVDDADADVLALVQARLSDDSFGPWLLILDGMDGIESEQVPTSVSIMDALPKSANGSILMTTRNRKIAVNFARKNVLDMPHDDAATALEILKGCLGSQDLDVDDDDERDVAMELLERLTFLPLAIVQAATYMDKNDISVTEYMSLWDDTEATVIELLSENFDDDWRYKELKNPVATTWLISFEKIRLSDPLAVDLLCFISCIEPSMIPRSLLPEASTKKKMVDAIGTLAAYSFVHKQDGGLFLNVHRLVHLAMRNWLRSEARLLPYVLQAMQRLVEDIVFEKPERSIWRAHLPHMKFVLAIDPVGTATMERFLLLKGYGQCLLDDGRYIEAEEHLDTLVELGKQLFGDEDVLTHTALGNVAQAIALQGRFEEAEKLYMAAVKVQEETLGKEHTTTLNTIVSVGSVAFGQGRLERAEKIFRHVLEVQSNALGAGHNETLVTMNNLGLVLQSQGKLEDADTILREALGTAKKTLGQDHAHTLLISNNLGENLAIQSHHDEAEALHRATLEARKRVLGDDHPDVLGTTQNLAIVLQNQGNNIAAEQMHREVLDRGKGTLGEHHPVMLKNLHNLAYAVAANKKPQEAEWIRRQVLEKATLALAEGHPDLLMYTNGLATMLLDSGRYAEAIEMLHQAFQAVENALAKNADMSLTGSEQQNPTVEDGQIDAVAPKQNHATTQPVVRVSTEIFTQVGSVARRAAGTLVTCLTLVARYEEATALQSNIVQVQEAVLGKEHPHTIASIIDLAEIYLTKNNCPEAERLQQEAMDISKRVSGEQAESTVEIANKLTSTMHIQGRFKEAEQIQPSTSKIIEVFGQKHPLTLACYYNDAELLISRNELDEAAKLHEMALLERKNLLGDRHIETIQSLMGVSKVYAAQQRYQEGEAKVREMIQSAEAILGGQHILTMGGASLLGAMLLPQGKLEEGEEVTLRALRMHEQVLGASNHGTAVMAMTVAMVLRLRGKHADSRDMLQRALAIFERIGDAFEPDHIQALKDLVELSHAQGWHEEEESPCRDLLTAQKNTLGPEHPTTLQTMALLGESLRHQGKLDEAETINRHVVECRRKVLGQDHIDTLVSYNNLALVLRHQHRFDEAAPLYKIAAGVDAILGENHPLTLLFLKNQAELLATQNNIDDARGIFSRVLEISKRTLGEDHADTLICTVSLAETMRQQGDFHDAEEILVPAFETSQRSLGADKYVTLMIGNKLARILIHQTEYTRAGSLLHDLLDTAETHLGDVHEATLLTLFNQSIILRHQNQDDRAKETLRRALAGARQLRGLDNSFVYSCFSELIYTHHSRGEFLEGNELCWELLEETERTLGPAHAGTLKVHTEVADAFAAQGLYADVEEVYRRILEARRLDAFLESIVYDDVPKQHSCPVTEEPAEEELEGEELAEEDLTQEEVTGEELADTLIFANLFGEAIRQQERYNEAEDIHQKILARRQEALGEDHRDTMVSRVNLALALSNQDQGKEALSTIQQAIKVAETLLARKIVHHTDIQEALLVFQARGEILAVQGRQQEAESLFRYVLETSDKTLGVGSFPSKLSSHALSGHLGLHHGFQIVHPPENSKQDSA
ncbi:hypothetical protein FE257_006297 [Aspergillus nanangensis]|uniref:NB-ARC domain-containing protein n=1 Tax=Aspergillus nanangensis TaxID=2582783 RepID=A0AAD4CP91_ASPNN|nr:hypothetical protein FE257_006297 [Aspergillus nanangensis]